VSTISDPAGAVLGTAGLTDKYRAESGRVLLTGVQAVARMLVEQHERDRRNGHRSATFVSGYQGSPLAGLDVLLASIPWLASECDIRLVPGLNEELAATAVWGSQIELPAGRRTHDGIVGVWYGKGPGLDRAGDAMRHMATYGAHPKGGMLAVVGDDPAAKSSSVPAASERSLAALNMPIVFPRNAEEIVRFGLHAISLSRASGCTVAMKLVADVADGLWTFDGEVSAMPITVPRITWQGAPWSYRQRLMAAPPDSLLAEADLYGPRWEMVRAFTDANELDRIEIDPAQAWLGIVAVGSAYDAVLGGLADLGLDAAALTRAGIRVMRVGMPYPLGYNTIRQLSRDVEQVLVVEDKMGLVESQVKDALYGSSAAPSVLGKRDHSGQPLIPANGELTSARLLAPLRKVLLGRVDLPPVRHARIELGVVPTKRTAYFCSGCPHNRSTAVPEGSLAGGGIGCHTLVTMSSRPDSQVTGLTQMGGEGAQWIGQAQYSDVEHIFQNIGDGTYFHSGQLAVQACIAAGVNITYKILYNSAVAMTGAQDAEGALAVPALTHKLAAEGVAQIIVCAEAPERYRRASLAHGTKLWHRDRLDEAQQQLRGVPGVTVLLYDQQCAAEARRKRKRGQLPSRRTRVVINEAVCEGCGDCGVKSNCLSVQPVDTEFGRKTRIDQDGCNTDYSCLDGECPSFVTVELPADSRPTKRDIPAAPELPEPELPPIESSFNIFLAGIGGTGIVTVNQVLATAALRSGLFVQGLDQTGLSQKAGPVTSHLRISRRPTDVSNRVGPESADCLLAFDLLTTVDSKNLTVASPHRTTTIASTSKTPTGDMVYQGDVVYPATSGLIERVRAVSRNVVTMDAIAASQILFGNGMVANFLLVGAAYQAGVLPISIEFIMAAIESNGVAVQANQAALQWGRLAAADPAAFAAATVARSTKPLMLPSDHPLIRNSPLAGEVRAMVARRAAELIAFQSQRTAKGYVQYVENAWRKERTIGTATAFSAEVARGLYKLTAYKDEYEVARLLTEPAFLEAVRQEVPGAENLTYQLHPPTFKTLGRASKIGFGPRSHVLLHMLKRASRLRGTPFDPFGYTKMRRLERALLAQYRSMINSATADLSAANYNHAVSLAETATLVKGYEDVKLASIERYCAQLEKLNVTHQIRIY